VLGRFQAFAGAQVEVVLVDRRRHHDALAEVADQPRDSTLACAFGSKLAIA
jgi:hypothetical protein